MPRPYRQLTRFEEPVIGEIASTIELAESRLDSVMDAIQDRQAELYADAIVRALDDSESILTVDVPMVDEVATVLAKEMESAMTDGMRQTLARFGLVSKIPPRAYPRIKTLSRVLAQVYAEKRAADLKFDIVRAMVVSVADEFVKS